MYCQECGVENAEEAVFCHACGHKIREEDILPEEGGDKVKTQEVTEIVTPKHSGDIEKKRRVWPVVLLSISAFLIIFFVSFYIAYNQKTTQNVNDNNLSNSSPASETVADDETVLQQDNAVDAAADTAVAAEKSSNINDENSAEEDNTTSEESSNVNDKSSADESDGVEGVYKGFGSNGQVAVVRVYEYDGYIKIIDHTGANGVLVRVSKDVYANDNGVKCVFDGNQLMFQNPMGVIYYFEK